MKGKTKYKDMSELPEWVREKLYSLRCKLYEPPEMTLDEYFRSKDYETVLVDDILYYTDTPCAKKIVGEYKTMEDNHEWLKDTLLTAVIKNGMVMKNRYGLFENSFTAWVDSLYNDKMDNAIYCTKETVKEIDNAILDEAGGEKLKKLKIAICGYLPHGLKVTTKTPSWDGVYDVLGYKDFTERIVYLDCPVYDEGDDEWRIESVTPYLRPMESMSEGERDYYSQKLQAVAESVIRRQKHIEELTDWLNKNKFDWRGLIPKGLALPAADGMYEQRIKTE